MGSVPPLFSFLLLIAAGWVHRHQLIVIEFLQAENRLLKDQLRGKRIRFTDAERALLARKAKAVGRKALLELETIVSPDTLLRWHRRLIAEKWNFVHRRRPGRPGIMQGISALIARMAQDNPGWGWVVDIVGITTRPDERWILQVACNLIDLESGAMCGKEYLILDRDTKYTDQFRRLIRGSGTNVIRLPPRSPNLNAHTKRFVRSIKSECLNRMIFIGHASLRRAVAEYVDHYYGERNHQGLDNRLIRAVPSSLQGVGMVRRKQRLGGMLNFYCREAV